MEAGCEPSDEVAHEEKAGIHPRWLALPRTEPSVSLEDGPWRQLQSGWNTELLLVRQPHPFHCFHKPSGFP